MKHHQALLVGTAGMFLIKVQLLCGALNLSTVHKSEGYLHVP